MKRTDAHAQVRKGPDTVSLFSGFSGSRVRHVCVVYAATMPQLSPYLRPQVREDPDNVALYSSFGPTPDGRIKPDVVGPGGDIVSAASGRAATGGAAT